MNHEPDKGLSSLEASQRLKRFGPNELPNAERRNLARIVLEIVRQPMFALLLGGAPEPISWSEGFAFLELLNGGGRKCKLFRPSLYPRR